MAAPATEGPAAPQAALASWNPHYCSLMDVMVHDPKYLPFDVPQRTYLEEVLLGLKGSPGDGSLEPKDYEPNGIARRYEALKAYLDSESAYSCLRALFWLSMDAVFHVRVSTLAQTFFREELGRSWHRLSIEGRRKVSVDRDLEWSRAAVPPVFCQAVYRLICDAFPEDRSFLIKAFDSIIEKVAAITYLETAGFRVLGETVRKERRSLFLKRVIKQPFINQRDLVNGQRRQEIAENDSKTDKNRPLTFMQQLMVGDLAADATPENLKEVFSKYGTVVSVRLLLPKSYLEKPVALVELSSREEQVHVLAARERGEFMATLGPISIQEPTPLNDTQLDHVMQGRAALLSPVGAPTPTAAEAPYRLVPDHLSVDRYEDLGSVGTRMLERNLQTLSQVPIRWRRQMPADGTPESRSRTNSAATGSATAGRGPQGKKKLMVRTSTAGSLQSEEEDGATLRFNALVADVEENEDVVSPQWKRARNATRQALALSKDRRDKERRQQQAKLHDEIKFGELAPELCNRELNTAWVSPVTLTLAPGAGKGMLQKGRDDEFKLKMGRNLKMTRSLSMPALKKLGGRAGGDDNRAADAMTVSQVSLCEESSVAGGRGRGRRKISTGGADHDPVALAGHHRIPAAGPTKGGGELVQIGPPATIHIKVIDQRLDLQAKAFQDGTFAEYMRNYDIYTNAKKQREEPRQLYDEEHSQVRAMQEMIGGPRKTAVVCPTAKV